MNTQTGLEQHITPMTMDFCYRCSFGYELPHSYETLFYDLLVGDKSIAVSPEEINAAWKVIQQIQDLRSALSPYECGTPGPDAEKAFKEKYKIQWHGDA